MRRAISVLGVTVTGLLALPAAAVAAPYTGLVVFGDSLSDIGNDQAASTALGLSIPGPYYYNGRFSNGPIYVDDLAAGLGLPAPTASLAGGSDYAYGDAMTTGTTFPTNVVVKDVDQQLTQYLGAHAPNATTLFDVYVGANDVIAQLTAATPNTLPIAARVAADVNQLYAAGARQFLVPNLPLIGETPEFNTNPTARSGADALTVQFDTALAADLAALSASNPGIVIHQLDVESLFAAVEANPFAFGLMNATASAAPGLSAGDTSYDTSMEVSNPSQYLFWDDIHPTTAGHALLGQAALAAVVPEPASLALIAGIGGLAFARRRRAR